MLKFFVFCICLSWSAVAFCVQSTAADKNLSPVLRADSLLKPEISLQLGHSATVTAVAVSPEGSIIATGSSDNVVKLWQTASGELQRSLRGLPGTVMSLTFAPQGQTLAAVNAEGQLCLWNVSSGALIRQWNEPGANVAFFAPDGRHLWTGSVSGQVKEWDVQTGRSTRTTINQKSGPGLLSFSPRLQLFASASAKKVSLWNAHSGALTKTLETSVDVSDLAFSPQGSELAVALSDKTVQLWDTGPGTLRSTFPVEPQPITRVAFAPDGKTIAIATALTVRLRDVKTGRLTGKMTHNLRLTDMAFTPDSKSLVRGSDDKTAVLWDVSSANPRQVLGRAATMWSLALAPDGKTLVAASEDKAIFFWDVVTGELTRTLAQPGGVSAVAFSPDGRILASSSMVSSEVQLWDAASGTKLTALAGHKSSVRALAFSPDGKLLASGSADNSVRLWDVEKASSLRVLEGHEKTVMSLAFAPDSATLASAGADKTIKCWNVADGKLTRTLSAHKAPVYAVAFSPDGAVLASNAFDKTLRLWDARSGALRRTVETKLQGTAVCFSPDGTSVVGNSRGTISVWDAQSGTLQHTLDAHESYVFSFAFLPGGQILASAGEDQIKLWDMKKRCLLASLVVLPTPQISLAPAVSPRAITADARVLEGVQQLAARDYLVVTEQGYYKGSAQADRFVKFRLGDELYPAECFQSHYYRPDLVRGILAGQEAPPVGAFKGARPPLARLELSPPNAAGEQNDAAQLSVIASDDSAVGKVEFLVNGLRAEARPLGADSRPLTSDSRVLSEGEKMWPQSHSVQRRFTVNLPLPAQTATVKVQAIVFDEDGLQSPRAEITLAHRASPPVSGRLLGLCIGVSRYVDERLNLRFAGGDAVALAAALQKTNHLYRAAQIQSLTDEQATAAGINAAIEQLVTRASGNDTVIISLSGHGWRDDKGSFYFATHEVNRHHVAQTALTWNLVVERLTQLAQKSRRVIVFLDACHSGSAATNEELVKTALRANAGVMLFAGSRGRELSLENADWGHGAFSKAILEALEGKASREGEKSLSMLDFMAYVAGRVKTLTENQQHPMVPYLHDFDTDAPFLSKP